MYKTSPHCPQPKSTTGRSVLIAIGAAAFIAIGVIAITVINIHARSSMSRAAISFSFSAEDYNCSPTKDPNYGKLVMFSGDTKFVAGANALLNKDCELDRGGFGVVYRTILLDDRCVAIKKLTVPGLIKSQEDFEREMKTLCSTWKDITGLLPCSFSFMNSSPMGVCTSITMYGFLEVVTGKRPVGGRCSGSL